MALWWILLYNAKARYSNGGELISCVIGSKLNYVISIDSWLTPVTCLKYGDSCASQLRIKSEYHNNIIIFRNADNVSIGDEVLVPVYDKLVPTKVIDTSDLILQGTCCCLEL